MATQKSVEYHLLDIRLGDGASPTEAFTAPCALRTRGISFESQTSETYLMDCLTPGTPGFASRNVTGKSATVSGSGTLDPDNITTWWTFFNNGVAINVQMHVNKAAGDGGGYWQGPFILTSFEQTGDRDAEGGLVTISVEMQSAGDVTWTAAT